MIHPGNDLQTRQQGLELFLLWYQALQENAGEHVRLIYATIIPGVNKSVKSADGRNHTFETLINDNTDGILTPIKIQFRVLASFVISFFLLSILTQI